MFNDFVACGGLDWMKLSNDQYLFMGMAPHLLILKIDYESCDTSFVSMVTFGLNSGVIDQLNERNFLIYSEDRFVSGSLIDENVILSQPKNFDFGNLKWTNLIGNQLIGFRYFDSQNDAGVDRWQFCKIDIVGLKEESVEIPFDICGHRPFLELSHMF
jgi:hypothetical protein